MRRRESGFGIAEGIVTIGLTAIITTLAASHFLNSARTAYDQRLRVSAEAEARTLLDMLAFDLRMAGAGMPNGQANFAPGGAGLGDAPLPVTLSSDGNTVTVRLNERGVVTSLSSDYDPSGGFIIDVVSTADFLVGDTLYISDMPVGGANGLRAEVTGVNPTQLTLDAGLTASTGAIFKAGSAVTRVSEVTFDSAANGITRAVDGSAALLLRPGSSFTISFLDGQGNSIALPLSTSEVGDELAAVEITVSLPAERPLKDGSIYTATASEVVALRNIVQ